MPPKPEPTGPGQESVWTYPRPAILEPTSRRLKIVHRDVVVADTRHGLRTLETSHPPTYYFPPEDIDMRLIRPAAGRSLCEWKGAAQYFDVIIGDQIVSAAAWAYPNPSASFRRLKDHLAFYATPFDLCTVDGEPVTPQAGGFYGGWITSREAGPFKGPAGTQLW